MLDDFDIPKHIRIEPIAEYAFGGGGNSSTSSSSNLNEERGGNWGWSGGAPAAPEWGGPGSNVSAGTGAFGSSPADYASFYGSGSSWDWGGNFSNDSSGGGLDGGQGASGGTAPRPAPPPLPSATTSNSYDLFRPTGYSYGWNEGANAFGLVNNPAAMNAFVTGGFRGTPEEYFARFGGGPTGQQPGLDAYQTPTIPGLPDAPEQGGFNPFYAEREMGGQDFIAPGQVPQSATGGPPRRMGAPTSRVVRDPLAALGSFDTWQNDWQNRFEAEEARRGEGQREAGYYGPTREAFATQVAQARGITDPSVILDTLAGRLDNYGAETMADFGAIERMRSDTPLDGWQIGSTTTTTRTPSRAADGVGVNWTESTSTTPFSANFDPANFGNVTSRQDFFGQRAAAGGDADWSDMLVRMALGPQAFGDFMNYERPFDPGFAGFEPTFEILNAERDRLEPLFEQRQRQQEAYDNMTSANETAGLLPEGYAMPDFRRVDGQTNAGGLDMGMGQAMGGGAVSGVSYDWLQGTYNPRSGDVTGVYDPRRRGGLGGLGGAA